MITEAITRLLIVELDGIRCRCGRVKIPRQTFCRGCYNALPPVQRKPLYKRVGQGYEEAYIDALRSLAFFNRVQLPEWLPAEERKS